MRSVDVSGMFLYRNVLYPAFFSIASRCTSSCSFPLWLVSSSSMTAKTLNLLSHSTKSATFLSKRFLVVLLVVVTRAEKATCASTM